MKLQAWLDKNLPDQKRPVSQSGIVNAKRCSRLFLYRHKWGIIPKRPKYVAAPNLGRLVHRIMQLGKDDIKVAHEEVMKTYNTLMERIKRGEDLEGYLAKEAKEIGDLWNKAVAVTSIYWDRYPPKEHIKTLGREIVLEAEYKTPLFQTPVPLVGIVDWPVEDTRNGNQWMRDFKTTSQPFETKMTGLTYGVQSRFYRFLAHECALWLKLKGFLLDIIKTPSIKLCGKDHKGAEKQNITPEEHYKNRVIEWYETQDETMDSRGVVFPEEDYLPSELKVHLDYACQLWEAPCVPEKFPRDITLSKCVAFRSQCPYYGLCSSNPVTWPAEIEQFYEIRTDSAGAQQTESEDKDDRGI